MQIKGESATAKNFDWITASLLPCNETHFPNEECASQEERAAYWELETSVHMLHIVLEYKQVDMKNSTQLLQPVNHLIRTLTANGKQKNYELLLAQNELVNKDDYIGFLSGDPETISYLSVDSQKESVEDIDSEVGISIQMMLSTNKYVYERSVYTFFTLIGDVGGFNGAIIILPTFLMAIYSERMYQGSI